MTIPSFAATDPRIFEFGVRRLVQLNLYVERANAAGQPVPPQVSSELQHLHGDLERAIAANPSLAEPAQTFYRDTYDHVLQVEAVGQMQHKAATQTEARELVQALRDRGAAKISARIFNGSPIDKDRGLNAEQLRSASLTGKFLSERKPTEKQSFAAIVKRETQGNLSAGEFEKLWQTAYDAPVDSPTRRAFADRFLRGDEVDKRRAFENLSGEMLTHHLLQRQDERLLKADPKAFDAREVTLTERDQRKLDLEGAFFKRDPAGALEAHSDRVDHSLEYPPDSVRGALGRAVADASGQLTEQETVESVGAVFEAAQ